MTWPHAPGALRMFRNSLQDDDQRSLVTFVHWVTPQHTVVLSPFSREREGPGWTDYGTTPISQVQSVGPT